MARAYRSVRAAKNQAGAKGHVPIFQHPNGKVVFYAHVPKTGGTYIEDLLVANGIAREFFNPKPSKWALKVSPQHWHRAFYDLFVDFDRVDLGFITVRHPVDRLLSEYRWRVKRKEAQSGFSEWLDSVTEALKTDPCCLDNHLRPQIDFFHPSMEVHRFELGFGDGWAQALGERAQASFTELSVQRRLQTRDRVDAPLSAGDWDRALAFCQDRYAQDFEVFDYHPEEATGFEGQSTRADKPTYGAFPEALIAPARKVTTVEARPWCGRGLRGGVYNQHGQLVPSSGLVRNSEKLVHEARIEPLAERDERVIFAGYNFSHFGHFLIESLARLWYLDEAPEDYTRIAWARIDRKNGAQEILPWQAEILALLRVNNPVEVIDQPTKFQKVVVPRPAAEFPGGFEPKMARFFERSGVAYAPLPGRKIWLSRSKLEAKGKTRNIEAVEIKLETAGWVIMHPQDLPIGEQVRRLSEAERVAGEEGSAFHLLLFIAGLSGMRVDILPRFETLSEMYWCIQRAKGFQQHEISMGKARTTLLPGRKADKAYRSFRPLLDALL